MKRRIFISHSGNDSTSTELITSLSSAFTRDEFDMFVDVERLKPGAKWRDEIYSWLGLCHGAVILLSSKAFRPGSVWVARESAILTWRNTLDPNFLIIPVLLPGVTTDLLRSDPQFRDLRLETFQIIQHENAAATTEALLREFAAMQPPGKTPLEEMIFQVETLLQGVGRSVLEQAFDQLEVDLSIFVTGFDPARTLAASLFQVPLKTAVKALEFLVEFTPDTSAVDRILDIIAPCWVDLQAARWIARCALEQNNKPAVVLNALTKFAADMYVRRAACKPPKTCWHVVPITAVFGENFFDDIAREIWQSLRATFADYLLNDPFADDQDQQLTTLLQELHQLARPVVVVCKLLPQANAIILRLRDTYPYLHFLFLSGPNLPDPDQFPETILRRIEPALPPGKEQVARSEFITARSILRPGG